MIECNCSNYSTWDGNHAEHCPIYIVQQKDKRIAELEAEVAYTRAESPTKVELQDEIVRLQSALREIAEHPHCQDCPELYAKYYPLHRFTADGIMTGHRCAAEIAKRALEGK